MRTLPHGGPCWPVRPAEAWPPRSPPAATTAPARAATPAPTPAAPPVKAPVATPARASPRRATSPRAVARSSLRSGSSSPSPRPARSRRSTPPASTSSASSRASPVAPSTATGDARDEAELVLAGGVERLERAGRGLGDDDPLLREDLATALGDVALLGDARAGVATGAFTGGAAGVGAGVAARAGAVVAAGGERGGHAYAGRTGQHGPP